MKSQKVRIIRLVALFIVILLAGYGAYRWHRHEEHMRLKHLGTIAAVLSLAHGLVGSVAAQTPFARDTFTDTPSTSLAAHAMTTGAGWTSSAINGSGALLISDANRVRCSVVGSSGTIYYSSTALSTTDYDVSADDVVLTTATITGGVATRIQSDGSCYFLTYDNSSGHFILVRFNAPGSFAVVAASGAQSVPSGTHTWTLQARGAGSSVTLTALVDGSQVATGTDTDASRLTTAGYPGIRFGGTDANGAGDQLDNFQAIVPLPPATATLTAAAASSLTLSVSPTNGPGPFTYQWYRSELFGFTPGAGTLISGATSASLVDSTTTPATTYFYSASVTDATSTTMTSNQVEATTLPVTAYNLVFVGNSLMQGAHATTGNDAGSVCLRLLGAAYANVPAPGVTTSVNLAIGGQSIVTLPNPNPGGYTTLTATAAACDAHLSQTLKNELVVWEITNEITAPPQTITAASVCANLKTYCLARRAAGWKVVVGTALPRSNQPGIRPDFEVVRSQVNTWVRANWPSFADDLFDPGADSRIGYPGDELSTTYYYQGTSPDQAVHMVDAGYAIAANYMVQSVLRLNAAQPTYAHGTRPTPKGGH